MKLARLDPPLPPPLSVLFKVSKSVLEGVEPGVVVSVVCRGIALVSVVELVSQLVRQPQAVRAVAVAQDMLGCIEESLWPQVLRL